jgi:hypothetical protein
MARMTAAKPGIEQAHNALLGERYDLSDRAAQGVTMSRGKPLQEGVRVKLPAGMTWERLAAMSPDQIRTQDLYPKDSTLCRIPTTPRAAWSFHTSRSTSSKSRRGAT